MASRSRNEDGDLTEAGFQRLVIGVFRAYGWRRLYHAPDNRPAGKRNRVQRVIPEATGFPDLVAIHDGEKRIVVAELKSSRGRIGPGQREWLDAFERVGASAYLWRPPDWDAIHDVAQVGERMEWLDPHEPLT